LWIVVIGGVFLTVASLSAITYHGVHATRPEH